MVSRQLPSRKITPWIIAPREIASSPPPPEQLPLRKIASVENCPPENCSLDDFSGKIIPKIIVPLTIFPWKFSPRKIAFRMICCQRNSPEENCPPRNIVPRINYTRYIFSPRIRNRRTLIDSCFLLFFFFVV